MTTRSLRIGGLAAASGLTRDALRYYERQGLLPRARRTTGGFREYDDVAVDPVKVTRKNRIGVANDLTLTTVATGRSR